MSKINKLEERRLNIIKNIQLCESQQFKLDLYLEKLRESFNKKEISKENYEESLKKILKGIPKEQWLAYYHKYIMNCKNELILIEENIEKERRKEKNLYLVLLFIIIIAGMLSIVYLAKYQLSITGFSTFGVKDIGSANGCGYVNSDLTITGNIFTNETCFIINASNLILNGQGFNISGNQTGYGINITRFQNITIKRLELNNFSIGIFINNSMNISIEQVSIQENLTNYGIEVAESTLINISNNNLTTTSNNIPAIKLEDNTNNTLIENNLIITRGSSSHGIKLSNAKYINITNNNITLFGESVNAIATTSLQDYNYKINFNRILLNTANFAGINITNGTNLNISFNNISAYNSIGIDIDGGITSNIENNIIITKGAGEGILLFANNYINLTISSNIISNLGGTSEAIGATSGGGTIFNSTITFNNLTSLGTTLQLNGLRSTNISFNNFTVSGTSTGTIAFSSGSSQIDNIMSFNNIKSPGAAGIGSGAIHMTTIEFTRNNFTNNIINVSKDKHAIRIRNTGTDNGQNLFSNINTSVHIQTFKANIVFENLTLFNSTSEIAFKNVTIYNTSIIETFGNLTLLGDVIFLNATTLLPFNTTANITFNGVSYNSLNDYAILRDNDPCPSTICTKLNFNPVRFQVTGFSTYNTTLEKYPEWYSPSVNKTSITQNDWINLGTYWTDTVGLDSYIFSIDNGTGTFENHSAVSFTGRTNSSNVTIQATYTGTVQWRFFANDSSNNINATDIQSFNVSAIPSPPQQTQNSQSGNEQVTATAPIAETQIAEPTPAAQVETPQMISIQAAQVVESISYGETAQQAAENMESSTQSLIQNPSESADTDGEVIALVETKSGDSIIIKSGRDASTGISVVRTKERFNIKLNVEEIEIKNNKVRLPNVKTGLIITDAKISPMPNTKLFNWYLLLMALGILIIKIIFIKKIRKIITL